MPADGLGIHSRLRFETAPERCENDTGEVLHAARGLSSAARRPEKKRQADFTSVARNLHVWTTTEVTNHTKQ